MPLTLSPPAGLDGLEYYLTRRDGGRSILGIWEEGGAYGDSVTPSTWSAVYRDWVTNRIEELCGFDKGSRILSVGSGNAFVEAILTRAGYSVLAVDAVPEAVALAASKGVEARVCDFWATADTLNDTFDMVYADGLIGHLLDRHTLPEVLAEFSRLVRKGGLILISNDSSEAAGLQKHPSVPGFYYVHVDLLAQTAWNQGLSVEFVHRYPYFRPVSGPRWRSVVALRTAAGDCG